MKLSITPSLGFSAPPSPSSDPSVAIRSLRPKRVSPASSKLVRPPVDAAIAPPTENE